MSDNYFLSWNCIKFRSNFDDVDGNIFGVIMENAIWVSDTALNNVIISGLRKLDPMGWKDALTKIAIFIAGHAGNRPREFAYFFANIVRVLALCGAIPVPSLCGDAFRRIDANSYHDFLFDNWTLTFCKGKKKFSAAVVDRNFNLDIDDLVQIMRVRPDLAIIICER